MTPLSQIPGFDPRAVPALEAQPHLLPVPPERLQPQALQQRFANPPRWKPEVVVEHKFADRLPARASVLVAVVMRERPMVLLTERTAHLSTHSGQIAFPGGKADEGDADAAATALREAHEEVGLEERFVEVIGTLPVHTTGTGFLVTPVVALVQPDFVLTPNPDEVADAFEVPLVFLVDPRQHRRHALEVDGQRREWFSMPYVDAGRERFIWGATAGMVRNLYRFLSA